MPGNIFLNYRRDDTAGHAGRLFDRLNYRFPGRVFRDVTSIGLGADFIAEIERKLGSCRVLIVLIGRQWLTIKDDYGRPRLHDPGDPVRFEVATGLRKSQWVIPVLVGGARVPPAAELPDDLKPLSRRNAIEITEPDFEGDVERLIQALEQMLGEPRPHRPVPPPERPRKSRLGLVVGLVAAALVVGVVGVVALMLIPQTPRPSPANVPHNYTPTPVVSGGKDVSGGKGGPNAPVMQDSFSPVGSWQVGYLVYHLYSGGGMEVYATNGVKMAEGQWYYNPQGRLLNLSGVDTSYTRFNYNARIVGGGGNQYIIKYDLGDGVLMDGVLTRVG